jgi:hypothetical protein
MWRGKKREKNIKSVNEEVCFLLQARRNESEKNKKKHGALEIVTISSAGPASGAIRL